MLQPANSDFARFVGAMLPTAIKSPLAASTVHRAMIAMHTGVLLEFVRRTFGARGKGKSAAVDEGTVTWVLLAAMEPLQTCAEIEVDASKESLIGEVVVSDFFSMPR